MIESRSLSKNEMCLGLLQNVQDLLQSQLLFIEYLTIEEFQTNKKLYEQIGYYNRTMQSTIEKLISITPSDKQG